MGSEAGGMKLQYHIKSKKGYWLPKGQGYTSDKKQAGVFTIQDIADQQLNLDGCTLERA
ncbi:MAG: hypothetical protein ACRCZI_09620 [Cetobacterium sp.]